MVYKLAVLSALVMVLVVDQADAWCCWGSPVCLNINRDCGKDSLCADGTWATPCCGHYSCSFLCCHCGGCRKKTKKRAMDVGEEAHILLDLWQRERENAMVRRTFEDHADENLNLSEDGAYKLLEKIGMRDMTNLPSDWFASMDTNGDGYVDPEEFDPDMAASMKK